MRPARRVAPALLTLTLLWGLGSPGHGARARKAGDDKDARADLIGTPAPDFAADFTLNGKTVKVSELKGKVVLLDFWAVWCGPCVEAFPALRRWHGDYKDLVVIGVTSYYEQYGFDRKTKRLKLVGQKKENPQTGEVTVGGGLKPAQEREMLKDFAAHYKLQYRLMMLPEKAWKQVGKDYRVKFLPTLVLIDRQGKIRVVRDQKRAGDKRALKAEILKLFREKK
jgi:thiol-disulfide isomerase/thioredoxin